MTEVNETTNDGKRRLTLSIKPSANSSNHSSQVLHARHGKNRSTTTVEVVKVRKKRTEEENEAIQADEEQLKKLELLKKAAIEEALFKENKIQKDQELVVSIQEDVEVGIPVVSVAAKGAEEPKAEIPEVKPITHKEHHHKAHEVEEELDEDGDEEEDKGGVKDNPNAPEKKKVVKSKFEEVRKSSNKLSLNEIWKQEEEDDRIPSLAALRRKREKEKKQRLGVFKEQEKIVREVVVPEKITVQELANRMSERAMIVTKELMKLGVMVKNDEEIDADTAELVISSLGHKMKRVQEDDVERILDDTEGDLSGEFMERPPVVTIMGHVDHGKTSLLDAIRSTDVAAGEAGGITQHIGAYQIEMASGDKITFLDTPGHEAFTEMRSRGAKVTDIVVLVVAADDGIMAQTVEAISHAKAAKVPIIVAINKIDKPGADPERVKQELLKYELVPESYGGDIMTVEVSAKARMNLDKLEEAILLQAEILDLRANYDRKAQGAVVEAKISKGKGVVATLLIQKGSLAIGDLVVAGCSIGRVRAMMDDKGYNVAKAYPGTPVEILGLDEAPDAGDSFAVVLSEKQAKEIVDYRLRKYKIEKNVTNVRISLEDFFIQSQSGIVKELPIILKTDVQGSAEAIIGSLSKIGNEEVKVKILHSAVGAITESDIGLAKASNALVIGFNVRANNQAKAEAEKERIDVRYYNIIYNLIDDVKASLSGMLSPIKREQYLGQVEIRQVFNITKFGKIAGSFVTEGMVKRGAGVRLLRDNIVIHDGKLKSLRRFKDEVKEVQKGYECGIAFENYEDIKVGDVVEVFEIVEERKTL